MSGNITNSTFIADIHDVHDIWSILDMFELIMPYVTTMFKIG